MNLEQNIANLNSEEYKKYLDFYANFHQERVKCLKRKNCSDEYIETPTELKIIKGNKGRTMTKPKYIFVNDRLKEIDEDLKNMEREIRNFRFLVETDTSKKIADRFAELKKKFLERTNQKEELLEYLRRVNNNDEVLEKKKEIIGKIVEEKKAKRNLYFEICKLDKDADGRKELIIQYLDEKVIKSLEKELKSLDRDNNINYIVTSLPIKKKSPVKKSSPGDGEQTKKKKIIKKRCPKGEKRDKKTGECVKKDKE